MNKLFTAIKQIEKKEYWYLLLFIVICQIAGLLGSLATLSSVDTWYASLVKPSLTPPGWVFGPIWTILYTLMGIATWLVWRTKSTLKKEALITFFIHLAFNALWSFLFFGLQSTTYGLAGILFLFLLILITIRVYEKVSIVAALLLIPYAFWVFFATYLSFGLLWLNR
ncbi:MAG TPA: TspO/MBR family protein [Vampirovibrionales bacterium]